MRDGGNQVNDNGGQDAEIRAEFERAWANVFAISNKILAHANKYGVRELNMLANPNLEEIANQLDIMDFLLKKVMKSASSDHDDQRSYLNAIRQIGTMKVLVMAYSIGEEEEVRKAIDDLHRQAVL